MSGIKGLLNLCFIPHLLLQNHQRIYIINFFEADESLINVEMLVLTKNCSILLIIQILDQK